MRFESTNCKHTQHSYRQLGYSNRFGCNQKKATNTHTKPRVEEKKRERRRNKQHSQTKLLCWKYNFLRDSEDRARIEIHCYLLCMRCTVADEFLSLTSFIHQFYMEIRECAHRFVLLLLLFSVSCSVPFCFFPFFHSIPSRTFRRLTNRAYIFHSDSISIDCDAGSTKSANKSI